VALFALGVMSILWTAVIAAAIFAEKVLARGPLISRGVALGLLVLGAWVTLDAGSIPGLGEPMEMAL
jgi:predicted metal-binding membrane protein